MKMMYTEFEQTIFDRALKNYKNKYGDHPGGHDIFYKTEIYKIYVRAEFWEKYLNSEEELL